MNTDKIDFTKTGVCALCARKSNVTLSEVIIKTHQNYTNCKTLMCPECIKLVKAKMCGKTLVTNDISHAKCDLKKMSTAMQKQFDSICASHTQLLTKTLRSNPDICHWLEFRKPSNVVLTECFGFPIDTWIGKKNDAHASRIKTLEAFNSMNFRCPVCNEKLVVNVKDPSKIEINDIFEFSCKNKCFHCDETDLATRYSASYDEWRFAKTRSSWNTYGLSEDESARRQATSITSFALNRLHEEFERLTKEFWSLRERYYRDDLKVCDKHKYCRSCSACYAELDKSNSKKLSEFRQKIAEANGWSIGADMTLDEMFNAQIKSILKPSEHCKVFCKMSPDNGLLNICGITGYECSAHAEGKTCKKCASCISGKPLGNFLALHKMCIHYKDGKCDLGPNKNILSHEDGTCRYANQFIFRNRGFPCEFFKFDTTLNLEKAFEECKSGQSHCKNYY